MSTCVIFCLLRRMDVCESQRQDGNVHQACVTMDSVDRSKKIIWTQTRLIVEVWVIGCLEYWATGLLGLFPGLFSADKNSELVSLLTPVNTVQPKHGMRKLIASNQESSPGSALQLPQIGQSSQPSLASKKVFQLWLFPPRAITALSLSLSPQLTSSCLLLIACGPLLIAHCLLLLLQASTRSIFTSYIRSCRSC